MIVRYVENHSRVEMISTITESQCNLPGQTDRHTEIIFKNQIFARKNYIDYEGEGGCVDFQ